MEGTEELVLLVGMGPKEASLALVQLDLSCLDGSGHAPLLCNQGGNFSMCLMVSLELSCDPPVFLGSGIVVHGGVQRVVGEACKEPMMEFSLFFDGDSLGRKELMPVDRLVNTDGAQAVETVQFDIGGENVHGVVTIGDWDEEVKDISFILLVPLRGLSSSLPLRIPPVCIFGPVFVGFFQVSRVHLMLCQIVASLFENLKLFLVVAADFLIFARNSGQSMCDEEEFLPPWVPMSFESSVHGLGR